MLLYLDNSVLNRPFDDQRQPRIWLETLSFSLVLTLIETGEARLIRSPIHDLENSRNPFALRRQWVEKCLRLAEARVALDEPVNPARWRWSGQGSRRSTRCTSLVLKPPARSDS